MPKDFAKVNVDLWNDPDFLGLPPAAQHLYLVLWTSPGLSYCGVHDWRPGRLAARSKGFTADHISTVADCLAARHFLVIDHATEEVLVRSWARFDEVVKQPKLAISFVSAHAEVSSQTLKAVLVHELNKIKTHEPGYTCWGDKRVQQVLTHPAISAKSLPVPADPFAKGLGEGLALGLPQGLAESQGKVSPRVSPPPTTTTTTTTTNLKTKEAPTDVDEVFEDFWTRYPRKVAKAAARKAWKRATKKADGTDVVNLTRSFAVRVQGTEARFIPHPATWLNEERWEDERGAQVAEAAGGNWGVPKPMPVPPPEIADDPERYATWLRDVQAD